MKKNSLILILCISFFLVGWCWVSKQKISSEYLADQYDIKTHNLDLRSQNLKYIPNICEKIDKKLFTQIRSLDLWDNQIKEIDKDISCLQNLQELDLSYNQISSIKNLDKLSTLKVIQLHKNNIKEISWLDKLLYLQSLNLGYNQITKTIWLEKLINLHELQLQHNQINDISWLSNLKDLSSLKLEFNQISDENQLSIIENMKNLKRISLGYNKLPEDKIIQLQNKINKLQ